VDIPVTPRVDGEYNAILPAVTSTPLDNTIGYRGNPTGIDDVTGAIGANQTTFADVSLQGDAVWTGRYGIRHPTPSTGTSALNEATLAFKYGFDRIAAKGHFENGYSLPPREAIDADTFFLADYCQFAFLVAQSSRFEQMAYLDGWVNDVAANARWIRRNSDAVLREDYNTPNRIFVGARALLLAGTMVDDNRLRRRGEWLMAQAVARMHADGWLMEKAGWDSGYQSWSLINLAGVWFYYDVDAFCDQVLAYADAACTWLVSRCNLTLNEKFTGPAGSVNDADNTRTVDPAHAPGPEGKVINYSEVVYSLRMATAMGLGAYNALADAVYTYWASL